MLLLLDGVTMLSLELHEVIVEEISCFEHHLKCCLCFYYARFGGSATKNDSFENKTLKVVSYSDTLFQ